MDYFMESLVSNLSPNASPLHSPSPVKGKGSQANQRVTRPKGPDLVDEGSVDIYGDILVEPRASDVDSADQNESTSKDRAKHASTSETIVGHKTKEGSFSKAMGDQKKEDFGSFSGADPLLPSDRCETEMLKAKIKELTLLNDKLKSENDVLAANKVNLTKNISCLFLTSRNELQKKEKEIEELRSTVKKLRTQEDTPSSKKEDKGTEDRSSPSSKSYKGVQNRESTQLSEEKCHSRVDDEKIPSRGRKHSGERSIYDCSQNVWNSKISLSKDRNRSKDNDSRIGKEKEERRYRNAGEDSSPVHYRSKEGSRRERPSNSSHQQKSQHTSISKVSSDNSSSKSHFSKSYDENEVSKSHQNVNKGILLSPKEIKSVPKSMTPKRKEGYKDGAQNHWDRKETKKSNREECKSPKNDKVLCGISSKECSDGEKNRFEDRTRSNADLSKSCKISSRCEQSEFYGKDKCFDDRNNGGKNEMELNEDAESSVKENKKSKYKSEVVVVTHQTQDLSPVSESCRIPSTHSPAQNDVALLKKDAKENNGEQSVQESLPHNSNSFESQVSLSRKIVNRYPNQEVFNSCVLSNQDGESAMSPNASLPFSKLKSPDRDTPKEIPSHNTNSQMLTNQTWPFENREATTTCGESSISQNEKPVLSKDDTDSKSRNPKSQDPVRAFPISDLKDGSNSSSCQLSNELLFRKVEEDVSNERLESNPTESKESTSASEEATSSSSGGGEGNSKESSTSKTSDTTSSELLKSSSTSSSSSSSSSNITVVPKITNFKSPLKSGFVWNPNPLQFEDSTNLTPPKPKHRTQSTPIKLPNTDYDSNTLTPSKSDNIMCTPNLIVLGDEETTCATMISPFKSNSIPSEFIPPGVRKEIKEVNTHFRHIRGKPEFLHTSPSNSVSPDVKSKVNAGLLPNDLGFQKTLSIVKHVGKTKDGIIPDPGSSSSKSEKSEISCDKKREEFEVDNCSGDVRDREHDHVVTDGLREIQPIIKMAFHNVFRKNVSDFKNEMSVKSSSKTNRRVLASRLKHSVRLVQSSPTLLRKRSTLVPPLNNDQSTSQQRQSTDGETGEDNEKEECRECSDPPQDLSESLEHQNSFVNEWVWLSSFNIKPPKHLNTTSQASKSRSEPNVHSNTRLQKTAGEEFSFKGKIPSVTCKDEDEDQILLKHQQCSEQVRRDVPISPTNSCRVTSSSLEFTEQEAHPVKQYSAQTNVCINSAEEVMNSPEPDSTSDPVVFTSSEAPRLHNSKCSISKQNSSSAKISTSQISNILKESDSPDSPTKCLGRVQSHSKSPRKRALDFRSCASPRRNKSITSCSGDEKLDTSQVESDLFLSSSDDHRENSDTDNENETTLNATFVINKVQSDSECENGNVEATAKCSSSFRRGKIGGKTPVGNWDEVSLMESSSLSEFDRDVVMPHQNPQVGTTRMSSRTASFSSHVSVGGFSPFSLASPKLTPSHIRSPKDVLWSPLNRTSESQDSCHEDVRTPVSHRLCDKEEIERIDEEGADLSVSPCRSDVDSFQLAKLFSLQELQHMELVKTRYGLDSSDSDSSSSGDSYGSGSESEDEDEDHPTPVKHGGKSPFSPLKSPFKHFKKSSEVKEVLQSPRVSKVRHENLNPIASSSQQPVVCRRSPRKTPQVLKSPNRSKTKSAKCDSNSMSSVMSSNKGNLSSLNSSPSKRIQTKSKTKLVERKNFGKIQSEEEIGNLGKDEALNEKKLRERLNYVYNSPQKSVRIVDENSSGENIVIGSCSKENNVLLKRLYVSNSESVKSPSVKNNNCGNSPKSCGKVESGQKGNVNIFSVGQSDIESDNSSGAGSSSDRRPLSLQDDDNIDPLLVSRQTEYVHNVIKVTRRLDLDKTKMDTRVSRESNKRFSGGGNDNRDKSDKDGMTVSKNDDSVQQMKNSGNSHGGKVHIEDGVEGEGKCLVLEDVVGSTCTNDNNDSDGVEDGEILDEGEEEKTENGSVGRDVSVTRQSTHKGDRSSTQSKIMETERLHITQDGCKTIASPKLMSRKKGKNFACRKDPSSHGISPMERVYTPPALSSRSDAREKRAKVGESKSKRRTRSRSLCSPERKRQKVEEKEKQSRDKSPRSLSPRSNSRRRSPNRGGSTRNKQLSSSNNRRPRSPRRENRARSVRNNRPRSPYDKNNRRVSPRKRAREERKSSPHRSPGRRERNERQGRPVERMSRRESGRSCERKNSQGDAQDNKKSKICDRSSNSHSHRVSKEDERCRGIGERHRSRRSGERSRSRSKDSSSSHGHHHRDRNQRDKPSSSKSRKT